MNQASVNTDPRWGQQDREKKAEAILRTVAAFAAPTSSVEKDTWLDIGCGSGGIAFALARNVTRVIGVDPENWERWSQYESDRANLTLQRGSYRELDKLLGPDSVDVVVCNQVYEHVDDPLALLLAIRHVLKPGGLCYFAGPNLLWPIEPHVFWPFVHWLPRGFAQRSMRLLGSKRAKDLDAWSWSYWRLMRAFRHTGFTAHISIRERIAAEAQIRTSRVLNIASLAPRMLVDVLTPFAPAFVFILRKPF